MLTRLELGGAFQIGHGAFVGWRSNASTKPFALAFVFKTVVWVDFCARQFYVTCY